MRRIIGQLSIVVILLLISFSLAAEMHPDDNPKQESAALQRMKNLVGTWQGTSSMLKEGETVTVEYELTSAGSLLVEKLFPGTPHEMVSTYYDDRGRLSMTHYCALKNQPMMRLMRTGRDSLSFNYVSGRNLDPEKDPHIHSLHVTFINENEIEQQWAMFENGKKAAVNKLNLIRVQ